jgi:hypothetical protein
MKIEDKLIQLGLNQMLIEFYHGRTRNKDSTIVSVSACPYAWKRRMNGEVQEEITTKVKLTNGRIVCYMFNIAKLRNKRLNLLMS